jgi:hypothetical protein
MNVSEKVIMIIIKLCYHQPHESNKYNELNYYEIIELINFFKKNNFYQHFIPEIVLNYEPLIVNNEDFDLFELKLLFYIKTFLDEEMIEEHEKRFFYLIRSEDDQSKENIKNINHELLFELISKLLNNLKNFGYHENIKKIINLYETIESYIPIKKKFQDYFITEIFHDPKSIQNIDNLFILIEYFDQKNIDNSKIISNGLMLGVHQNSYFVSFIQKVITDKFNLEKKNSILENQIIDLKNSIKIKEIEYEINFEILFDEIKNIKKI